MRKLAKSAKYMTKIAKSADKIAADIHACGDSNSEKHGRKCGAIKDLLNMRSPLRSQFRTKPASLIREGIVKRDVSLDVFVLAL